MGHIQPFTEVLHAFFRDFLKLFFPDVEARLDFGSVEFLDTEVFTGLGDGSFGQADIVAKLPTREGDPVLIFVHVELQSRAEADVSERMFEYYCRLRLRHPLPVLPIVVYLRGGKEAFADEEYRVTHSDFEIIRFRYDCIRLARLDVEEYRKGVGPVGAALGALMDSSRTPERAELRASLLLQIIESELDDRRQLLLANLVEKYLELSAEEWERYRQLVSREEYRIVQDVEESWMDRLLREGEEKGLEQGREQGREEGLRAGLIAGKRETLSRLMTAKFGPLSAEITNTIESLRSMEELDRYLERVLTAASIDEMGLG